MASEGYSKGTATGSRRDPQLVADPSGLVFDLEDTYPQEYHSVQKHAKAINPNVVYSPAQQHTVYIPPTVVREQYCICAPRTPTERRLLVVVVVLSIVSVMLLTALASVLPMVTCGDDCHHSGEKPGGVFDFLMAPDFVAPVAPL